MKLKILALLTACMIGAVAPEASATFQGGEDLNQLCRGYRQDQPVFNSGYCLGYVVGVADTIQDSELNFGICFPQRVTAGTLTDIVVKYLQENPSKRQYNGFSTVWTAFHEAYPCKR